MLECAVGAVRNRSTPALKCGAGIRVNTKASGVEDMDNSVARLFREYPDFDEFKRKVRDLRGAFGFGQDDMVEIGEAYFERYPDCFSNRNCSDVTLGYKLVRLCVIEKMVEPLPEGSQETCREMLHDLGRIEAGVARIIQAGGAGNARESLAAMASCLREIQETIDTLPTGMIKERFVGGVSYIHNIMYLLKSAIDKAGVRA